MIFPINPPGGSFRHILLYVRVWVMSIDIGRQQSADTLMSIGKITERVAFFHPDVMLSMALPPCSSTCLDSQTFTNTTCLQQRLVRKSLKTNTCLWERCLMRLFTQCCLNSHCSLIKGIVAGSSCPPEIARKLVTDMDVKEMMVNWHSHPRSTCDRTVMSWGQRLRITMVTNLGHTPSFILHRLAMGLQRTALWHF